MDAQVVLELPVFQEYLVARQTSASPLRSLYAAHAHQVLQVV